MEMPTVLGKDLKYCADAKTENELLELLIANPQDLVDFVEHAIDDETWSSKYSNFTKNVLQWLTEQHLKDNLLHEYGLRIVKKIQKHKQNLSTYLPLNIEFHIGNRVFPGNSMLFGVMSPYLQDIIRREYSDTSKNVFKLPNVSTHVFVEIEEFVTTGDAANLWREEQNELIDILHQAVEWEFFDLATLCQDVLKRYITITNVIETLLLAHHEQWEHLRSSAFDFINNESVGVEFRHGSIHTLTFVFHDFKERAMRIFNEVKDVITHLGYTLDLTEDTHFSETVVDCPGLIGLDISRTRIFNERLYHIPSHLTELDLSKNTWLDDFNLGEMIKICPSVNKLFLNSSAEIGSAGWSRLNKLKRLEYLDISRCYQLGDTQLKLVIRACRELTHLNLEECTGISDRMFFEFAKLAPNIEWLNIARCKIDDSALIELLTRSSSLETLDLTHCEQITEKGVIEAVRHTSSLVTLNISQCHLPADTVSEILKIRSFLKVIV